MAASLPFIPRATGAFFRVVAACLARVEVAGLENVPDSGPLLVVANHASNVDGILLMAYVVPQLGRPMRWLGKEEALRWPFFGWAMRSNGVFAVKRGGSDVEAFHLARRVLGEGGALAIFPEGTRSRDGALQAAHEGAAVLAIRSGAPVLPIGIAGSHRFWPRGGFVRPGRRMKLTIGPVFRLDAPALADRHEATRRSTVELMRHIAELLPEEQRGVYAAAVATTSPGATDRPAEP